MKTIGQTGRIILIIIISLLTTAYSAYPWGPNGHRIVGQIGENHLTDEAKSAIEKIMGSESLAQAATWPDEIRSDEKWDFAYDWHFLSVDDDQKYAEVIAKAAEKDSIDNVVEAVDFFADILRGEQKKIQQFQNLMNKNKVEPPLDSVEVIALRFLIHFVGDVHQPLHVGRRGDMGGNKVSVNWFGEESNLHKVWDEGLIEGERLSFSEFVRFIDHPTGKEIIDWQELLVDAWAMESIARRHQVYEIDDHINSINHLPDLGYKYAYKNMPVIKQRLLQAGVRLAGLLNSIFQSG